MHLLLDACVALNLQATDAFDAIAETLGLTFTMAREAAGETNYLVDVIDGETRRTEVDLDLHVQKDTLEILELRPGDEVSTFVSLARRVDDGEAQSLALALHRDLPFATDDRMAIKVAHGLGLATPTGTATLLKRYADHAKLGADQVRSMLLTVERRASFRPPREAPDMTWWTSHSAPRRA